MCKASSRRVSSRVDAQLSRRRLCSLVLPLPLCPRSVAGVCGSVRRLRPPHPFAPCSPMRPHCRAARAGPASEPGAVGPPAVLLPLHCGAGSAGSSPPPMKTSASPPLPRWGFDGDGIDPADHVGEDRHLTVSRLPFCEHLLFYFIRVLQFSSHSSCT